MASTSDSMEDVVVLEPEAAAAGAAGAPVAWTVPQALGVVTVARDQLIRTLSRRGGLPLEDDSCVVFHDGAPFYKCGVCKVHVPLASGRGALVEHFTSSKHLRNCSLRAVTQRLGMRAQGGGNRPKVGPSTGALLTPAPPTHPALGAPAALPSAPGVPPAVVSVAASAGADVTQVGTDGSGPGDDLEQIDLSDMEVDCDIDREAQYVGETGGGGSSGAGSGAGASAGSSSHGDGGAVAGSDSGVAGRIVGVLDGCGISTAASSGAVEDDSETLPERVVLGVAAPGLGCSDGLTMDSIAAVLSDSPGIPRAALAALGIALSAGPAEELAGAGVPNSVGAASGAASRRARRLGLMMDVEQGEGKASKSMHVSSVISMLNCIPSASTDRMLRIIEAAKAQVKEEDTGVKKTVGVGLTRGSLCAVLFDNDGTGDDPSTVWYGFVRRYGVRAGTRFKEWMKPVDFDDDTVDEKLVLQFTWLAPADRKHWGRTPGVPTYAFKSFGASGSQEGKKRGLCVQLAHVRVQDVTIRFDDGDGSCGCFVVTVPIACVIGVVKYDRVSSGKGSIPKLFRIDPADADVVESAARGIVLQRGLQAAGKAGSGTGSKKKPKNKATGQVKRSTKAGAGGAGAAVGSTDVGTEGDGGGGITGLLKHIRLRACPRTGLRSTVTQFTVGK